MRKTNFLLLSVIVLLGVSPSIMMGSNVYADEDNILENDKTLILEQPFNGNIVELRAAASTIRFDEYVFMQNKPHGATRFIPTLSTIWQVKYKNGVKYQGNVTWNGQYKNGTHIGAYYRYTGTLKKA